MNLNAVEYARDDVPLGVDQLVDGSLPPALPAAAAPSAADSARSACRPSASRSAATAGRPSAGGSAAAAASSTNSFPSSGGTAAVGGSRAPAAGSGTRGGVDNIRGNIVFYVNRDLPYFIAPFSIFYILT